MFTESPTAVAWGAVFTLLVLAACVTDVRSRRIPNVLVVAVLAGGLVHGVIGGDAGSTLWRSAAGIGIGFATWILFYVGGVIGAGDVKFFAAAGAWLGPAATWRAALIAAVVGGVLALAFLLWERRLVATLRRVALAVVARRPGMVAQAGAGQQYARMPYGVALAIGVLVAAWFPL